MQPCGTCAHTDEEETLCRKLIINSVTVWGTGEDLGSLQSHEACSLLYLLSLGNLHAAILST